MARRRGPGRSTDRDFTSYDARPQPPGRPHPPGRHGRSPAAATGPGLGAAAAGLPVPGHEVKTDQIILNLNMILMTRMITGISKVGNAYFPKICKINTSSYLSYSSLAYFLEYHDDDFLTYFLAYFPAYLMHIQHIFLHI